MKKANPEKAKELLHLLTEWRQQVDASMPRLNPEYSK